MKKNWMILIACLALAVVSVMTLGAQAPAVSNAAYSIPEPGSAKSASTAGRLGGDVDDFLDESGYSGVDFSKVFAFFEGTPSEIGIGTAMRFGGVYVGAYYNGDVSKAWNEAARTQITTTNQNSGATPIELYNTTTVESVTGDPQILANNTFGVLVGVAGMGFKLGYYGDTAITDKAYYDYQYTGGLPIKRVTSYADGRSESDEVTEYALTNGWFVPSLAWGGLKLGVGSLTIKPRAGVLVGIYADSISYKRAVNNTNAAGYSTTSSNNGEFARANGFVRPEITVGADVDFSPNFGAGVDYAIGFDLYDNKYGDETAAGTVRWRKTVNTSYNSYDRNTTITTTMADITEKTNVNHTITPSVKYSGDLGDRLSFGAKLKLATTFGSASTTPTYEKTTETQVVNKTAGVATSSTTTKTVTSGSTSAPTETTTFGIAPTLAAGLSYQLVQDTLALNIGVSAPLLDFTSTTTIRKPAGIQTTTSYDANGNVTSVTSTSSSLSSYTDRQTTENKWNGVTPAATVGLTWTLAPQFTVDALVSSSSLDGTFGTYKLVFSAKF
jgi:YD repeat-containing protein